jgi:hypothetical protein
VIWQGEEAVKGGGITISRAEVVPLLPAELVRSATNTANLIQSVILKNAGDEAIPWFGCANCGIQDLITSDVNNLAAEMLN